MAVKGKNFDPKKDKPTRTDVHSAEGKKKSLGVPAGVSQTTPTQNMKEMQEGGKRQRKKDRGTNGKDQQGRSSI